MSREGVDGPAPRASRLPPLSRRGKAMPESGRVPGRIRRGLPLPSRPLREHQGSRSRARYQEKNAPLRSKTREILFKLSISVLRQLRKSFDRGFLRASGRRAACRPSLRVKVRCGWCGTTGHLNGSRHDSHEPYSLGPTRTNSTPEAYLPGTGWPILCCVCV